MSQWTHPICDPCWAGMYQDRQPVPFIDPPAEVCCVCAEATSSGIYVREDPDALPAHHEHDDA